jgi:hypothetical protein
MVRQLSQHQLQRNLLRALRLAAGERFQEKHLEILPAYFRELKNLQIDLTWEYPRPGMLRNSVADSNSKSPRNRRNTTDTTRSTGSTISRRQSSKDRSRSKDFVGQHQMQMQNLKKEFTNEAKQTDRSYLSNYLDGACMVFEGQGLRELVDYRGPHGVRLVCNGVVDYLGVWTGKIKFGDATAGAVIHAAEEMDNVACAGKHTLQVELDKLPEAASDLYFVMSTPNKHDIACFNTLCVTLRDRENPGHEIASSSMQVTERTEAVNMACLSRTIEGYWSLAYFGSTSEGNAHNYLPMLLCLHSIQAQKDGTNGRAPQWPHRSWEKERGRGFGRPLLPRLPKAAASKESTDGSMLGSNLPFSPSLSITGSVTSGLMYSPCSTPTREMQESDSFAPTSMSSTSLKKDRPSSSRGPGRMDTASDRRAANRASRLSSAGDH